MVPIVLACRGPVPPEQLKAHDRWSCPSWTTPSRYFVNPVDLIPEMTQGMAGLLDDTYLAFRILENLNRGSPPLMDTDFDDAATASCGGFWETDDQPTSWTPRRSSPSQDVSTQIDPGRGPRLEHQS